ncbi:MAG TPA: Ig-like domain-containing protein, partial [Myxococcota bacterium]|nr:Ig-like domain-containing protein [Myxococcota bacterium]
MGRGLETFWQVALTPVLLLACSPTLELPLDTNILCASDADCPDGWRCEVVVGRCIDPTIVDEEPPVLLAASALDSTVLVLDFSERVDPGSVSTASFAITPSLVVEAAFVESSLRQVRLITSLQEPGEQYTVTPTGVVDLADNAIEDGSTQTFNGFGAAPDREPPGVLAPRGALPIKPPEVTLVWTRRALARNYTVEVAYDAAFTQLVAGFPIIVEDPDSSLTHIFTQPVRYYWRVRANTTRDDVYGEGSFDRIDGAVFVYCPAGTTCSDADGQSKPLPGNV